MRLGLYLLNVAYTPVVAALLQWTNCSSLPDGTRYHTLAPYLACEDGWTWGLGVPFLLLYGVGYPALMLDHILRPQRDQAAPIAVSGETRAALQARR